MRQRCEHGYVIDPEDRCPECERDALRRDNERLRAALLPLVAECIEHCGDNCECYYETPESCPTWQARAALEEKP